MFNTAIGIFLMIYGAFITGCAIATIIIYWDVIVGSRPKLENTDPWKEDTQAINL